MDFTSSRTLVTCSLSPENKPDRAFRTTLCLWRYTGRPWPRQDVDGLQFRHYRTRKKRHGLKTVQRFYRFAHL